MISVERVNKYVLEQSRPVDRVFKIGIKSATYFVAF